MTRKQQIEKLRGIAGVLDDIDDAWRFSDMVNDLEQIASDLERGIPAVDRRAVAPDEYPDG